MNRPAPQLAAPTGTFTQLLSSTRRGARLARLLAVAQLRPWGVPQDLTERAEVVVAELAGNAVLHGRVPGRCFRLTLTFDPSAGRLRVEVSDARGDLYPQIATGAAEPDVLRLGGRGLTLVTALADHWDCVPYPPVGKTVRAVLSTGGEATAVTGGASGAVRLPEG
ncbi:ATP-binding protein [Streptomyces sp. Li-HN-5-11]|uniref:ATP-binding protein n=1 Tax=Streptomyces sp. Li-HN-5-11 TaxID=3075432 RepID=UPI0028AC6A7E|nr:ATP-binding protein [Streptomyces sp. Li-HN-5-11]WNM31333.1 ATP-binding protein [Streptomyces sp. Li-HN-5-11]